MAMSEQQRAFLDQHKGAAMITVEDGVAKVARVAVVHVDGRLWSSGTADRVRTGRLRRDPRCTLFVFDPGWSWLALETSVRILDGPDAPQLSLRLFRVLQDRPSGDLSWFGKDFTGEAFLEKMVEEGRIIYEFEVHRAYGMY